MSSAHVRGQAKPFEKTSSNKRKRATQQNPTHTSTYLNMHPPPAAQELSDHHMRTPEAAEDQEAAALLNHMHHLHHDNHPRHSDNHVHGDYHENGNAAGNRFVVDREVRHPHPRAGPPQFARENSGSSDASATNYFSGDSDLTAEPIVGCAADEEGAKSSNSGSSTHFKVPRRALPSPARAQALVTAGEGQECSINLQPHHVRNTGNDKEEAAISSPTIVPVMQPSTSTTSTSMRTCNGALDSKPLASSQQMYTRAAGMPMMSSCHYSSQVEGADSGGGAASWLDLRLGYSAESKQHQAAQNMKGSLLTPRDEHRKSGESLKGGMESAPVTLQLLPDNPKLMNVNGTGAGACAGEMRAGVMDPRSCHRREFPLIYRPTAPPDSSHARPKLAENQYTVARFVPPDHQQIPGHPAAASALQPSDQQRFLMNQSNNPAADLHQSNQQSLLSYDQAHGYAHSNDQGRWLAPEASDMLMMTTAAPVNAATARPAEIYRPTASLGWPANRSVESRPWSPAIRSTHTPPVHMQRAMSWQGLLRSMTTDALLHPLPDLPMCSFDSAPPEMPESRRRQMFPGAIASRPPQPAHTRPANHQSLRLSTSRRSAGLWFSLQEAQPYSHENMEDEEEQHSSMQKVYLRIRDGKMQISVLQSYLVRKLQSSGSYDSHEVEITCRGKTLAPTFTIQQVRDTIWLNKEVELNEAIGFRYTHRHLSDSHTKIMALFYERHHTHAVTLNLLKT